MRGHRNLKDPCFGRRQSPGSATASTSNRPASGTVLGNQHPSHSYSDAAAHRTASAVEIQRLSTQGIGHARAIAAERGRSPDISTTSSNTDSITKHRWLMR